MNKYLTIDIGTSSIKVAVFSETGKIICSYKRDCVPFFPAEGYVEQDAEDWWVVVKGLLNDVFVKEDPRSISCIVISGQTPACVPIDEDGKPVRPAIIWMDRRSSAQTKWLKEHLDNQMLENSLNNLDSYFGGVKWLWYLQNEPELYQKTWKILQANSYISYLLTGMTAIDPSQAGICDPCYNVNIGEWNESVCGLINLDIDKLPTVYPSEKIIGHVSFSASAETGLAEGTPVACGGGDFAFACLSAGVYQKGRAALMLGTAGNLFFPNPTGADSRLINTFHITGERLALGGVLAGGVIAWIREVFGNLVDFDTLEKEAIEVLPGAEGLTLLPYLLGERTPVWDPDARGVLIGLSLNHKRGHIYRAALEGISFGFKQIQEILKENGDVLESVVAIDGGAQSALWRQILANVLQVPLDHYPEHGGTSLGAAYLAAKAVGQFEDFTSIDTWLGPAETTYPDKSMEGIYQQKYEIYKNIYPLFKKCMK